MKTNPNPHQKSQQKNLQLKGGDTFESLKFHKDAEFLIDVFLNYGDISVLNAAERQYVERIIKEEVQDEKKSGDDVLIHRGVFIEKILAAFEEQSYAIANCVERGKKQDEKKAREKRENLFRGAQYLQKKLNLNLTELSAFSDSNYQSQANRNTFADSTYGFKGMTEFLFGVFPDKVSTTQFILSLSNPHDSHRSFGLKVFLCDQKNKKFIKENFMLTLGEREVCFQMCHATQGDFLNADQKLYSDFKNHYLLNDNLEEKALKNKAIMNILEISAYNNINSRMKIEDFKNDEASIKALLKFLKTEKKENTHHLIEISSIENVVTLYLVRNAVKLNVWKNQFYESEIKSIPRIVRHNDNIQKLLESVINLFPNMNISLKEMKNNLEMKYFEAIKNDLNLNSSGQQLKNEYLISDSQKLMQSLILNHSYKDEFKCDSPDFIKIEKIMLSFQMSLRKDENQAPNLESVKSGAYKI